MFYVATLNQFFSGGLALLATQVASINHITALRILNFIPRAKDLTAINCSPHAISTASP